MASVVIKADLRHRTLIKFLKERAKFLIGSSDHVTTKAFEQPLRIGLSKAAVEQPLRIGLSKVFEQVLSIGLSKAMSIPSVNERWNVRTSSSRLTTLRNGLAK